VLLIQGDTTPPVSALHPAPANAHTDTVTLTWEVSDDLSGHWYTEVERAPQPDGPWTQIAGWQTAGVTATVAALPTPGAWYFRARARDNVGNWEAWPEAPEAATTYVVTRTVALSVTAYLDENGDGAWDAAEAPASGARLVWLDGGGAVVTETVGAAWHVTRTVTAGGHQVRAVLPKHLPAARAFTVEPGPGILEIDLTLGLRAVKGRVYLPLVLR
jgi:hypothetical protein